MIPVINIGALPHYGTIQTKADTSNGSGGFTRTWADEATRVPMAIKPIDGEERVYGMQLQTKVTHEITMRYREGMTTDKRIVHKGVAYNIRFVNDVELRNKKLVIFAEQGVAN